MPVLEDEAGTYGYTAENRHMVEAFRKGTPPLETFHDGAAVVEMLMALCRSAELGQTVQLGLPHADARFATARVGYSGSSGRGSSGRTSS